jgi:hypothetical protein
MVAGRFDEAHRLTPASQYLGAARQLTDRTHHLLLTAAPHRGKESASSGLCPPFGAARRSSGLVARGIPNWLFCRADGVLDGHQRYRCG